MKEACSGGYLDKKDHGGIIQGRGQLQSFSHLWCHISSCTSSVLKYSYWQLVKVSTVNIIFWIWNEKAFRRTLICFNVFYTIIEHLWISQNWCDTNWLPPPLPFIDLYIDLCMQNIIYKQKLKNSKICIFVFVITLYYIFVIKYVMFCFFFHCWHSNCARAPCLNYGIEIFL